MTKQLFYLILFTHLIFPAIAQVSINADGTPPSGRAMLEIKSNSKGMLLPRMTTQERKAIAVQAGDAGLLVFDTDQQTLFMYDGLSWMPINFSSSTAIAPVNRSPIPALSGGHNFGRVVAISGNYAFISSGQSGQDDKGSVYVFERTAAGWSQQVKLTASDAYYDRHFGSSIAVHGDYAVIGTQPVGNTTGGAYVFVRNGNTWTEQVKLMAPDGVQGDYFGIGVAITTDMILVGARGKEFAALPDVGCIYVFKRSGSNWNYAEQFFPNAPANLDNFGQYLAVHNNYLVVGMPKKTLSGITEAGIAQVFFYNGTNWTYQATLLPLSINISSQFGKSVAIYNDQIAIGQPGLTVSGNLLTGRVSIYTRSGTTWTHRQSVTANDGQANDMYGSAVALNNNYLLVGAPRKSNAAFINEGIVYAYKYDAGIPVYSYSRTIKDIHGQSSLEFGQSVAIDAILNSYIIGSPGKKLNSGQVSFGLVE